jgi:hypothetical protein
MTELLYEQREVAAIGRKYGQTLIAVLRDVYGPGFANDVGNEQTLSDALPELDDRSLALLLQDYRVDRLDDKLAH